MVTRHVVLVFGPPGAGKSTYAEGLGLPVFDLDDARWSSEGEFTDAIRAHCSHASAQAVVIRTGTSPEARRKAVELCDPTATVVMDTPLNVCIQRIRDRRRGDVGGQITGARSWWRLNAQPLSDARPVDPAPTRRTRW